MIYITGDTHGDTRRFTEAFMTDESSWNKEDYLIVCGDFGFIFSNNKAEAEKLDYLAKKPYTICFVDGNHENFPAIEAYPTADFCKGKAHKIRENIYHLMRGQVYEIEGKTFFTMGGAYSTDRYMRELGESYWEEEIPSGAEYREALINLKEHKMQVDYIITHTAPREIIRKIGKHPSPYDFKLTGFLDFVKSEVGYKHWFCGHWHEDRDVDGKFSILYFDIRQI